jgi:hypothetical protein
MKYVFMVAMLLTATGCATNKPLKYEVPGLEKSSQLIINDLRPQSEKERKTFSLMITNEAYGIYRNGEDAVDPSPVRLLQHNIYEKFSSSSAPIEVKLYHFVTYTNARAALKKVAVGSIFGPVGAVIANSTNNKTLESGVSFVSPEAFDATIDKEFERALYSDAENPQKASAFVIYLDAEINGKRTSIRKISPTIAGDGTNPYVSAVDGTIQAFLSHY